MERDSTAEEFTKLVPEKAPTIAGERTKGPYDMMDN